MKYLLIINQTKKNWYLALINNKLAVSKNPKVYYESKDKAIMDLYTIKYSAMKYGNQKFLGRNLKEVITKIQNTI